MLDKNVLLLRSQSSPDPYDQQLRTAGYHPYSLPVLETVFVALDRLSAILRRPPSEGTCTGVILTSARAAEAWRIARISASHGAIDRGALRAWTALPFYVVGRATAEALVAPDPAHPDLPLPSDIRGAEQTGSSEKLARFILDDLRGRHATVMYLTGDKNKDTLPAILATAAVELDAVQVYATQVSSTFDADLEAILDTASRDGDSQEWWIVFFAPSSASLAVPRLQAFDLPFGDPPLVGASHAPRRLARLAAIGPTTSDCLVNELLLRVDVVAPKPSAESLSDALRSYDEPRQT